MKRTVTEVHETTRSNSSYGNFATSVTVFIDYENGTTRTAKDNVFTMRKKDALEIEKGMVLCNVR